MAITRRRFLLGALGAGAAGAAGLGIERGQLLSLFDARERHPLQSGDGVLVLVTLYGGNDGLNTIIPYADSAYRAARGSLAYGPKEVIPLDDHLGMHPNLKELHSLWDAKRLAIVRGVGYPDPNRSHFRSMDIWQSASPREAVPSGWLGRWLERTGGEVLRAVAIGTSVPLALVGERVTGTAVPVGPFSLPGTGELTGAFSALAQSQSTDPILVEQISRSGADLVAATHTIQSVLASKPSAEAATQNLEGGAGADQGQGVLARQLDLVATLVTARVPTRAYAVSLGGFDTHAAEKDTQARLLGELDKAVGAFFHRLATDAPSSPPVTVLVHSEFGRRVVLNASGGTDHGTAQPVLVLGAGVRGGLYGDEPSLTRLDDGDLRATTDFRSVYATVLGGVLGVGPEAAIPGRAPKPLGFL